MGFDLSNFRDAVLSADPNATKFKGAGKGNYTVWFPENRTATMADDREDDAVHRVYVHRFTKQDNDPVVEALAKALDTGRITFIYDVDYEEDTGYIHHTFTCRII